MEWTRIYTTLLPILQSSATGLKLNMPSFHESRSVTASVESVHPVHRVGWQATALAYNANNTPTVPVRCVSPPIVLRQCSCSPRRSHVRRRMRTSPFASRPDGRNCNWNMTCRPSRGPRMQHPEPARYQKQFSPHGQLFDRSHGQKSFVALHDGYDSRRAFGLLRGGAVMVVGFVVQHALGPGCTGAGLHNSPDHDYG